MIEAVRRRVLAIPRKGGSGLPFAEILLEVLLPRETDDEREGDWGMLPDGTRFPCSTEDQKSSIVRAWREWGKGQGETAALTFRDLRLANLARRGAWRTKRDPEAWTLPQWGNALCGELGEACNLIKKIDRGDFGLEAAREDLGDELCDILTYLDLLALCAGIDLEEALLRKWNKVSERVGSPVRLAPNFKEPS